MMSLISAIATTTLITCIKLANGDCFGAYIGPNALNDYPYNENGPMSYVLNHVGTPSQQAGTVTMFRFYARRRGDIRLQIYRPQQYPTEFTLIGEEIVTAEPGLQTKNTNIEVKSGDRVGFTVNTVELVLGSFSAADSRGSLQTDGSRFASGIRSIGYFNGPDSRRFPVQACFSRNPSITPPVTPMPPTVPPSGLCYGNDPLLNYTHEDYRGPAIITDSQTSLDPGLLVGFRVKMTVSGESIQVAVLRPTLDTSTFEIRYLQKLTSKQSGLNIITSPPALVRQGDRLAIVYNHTRVVPVPYSHTVSSQSLSLQITSSVDVKPAASLTFTNTINHKFAMEACLVKCQLNLPVARLNTTSTSQSYTYVSSTSLQPGLLSYISAFINVQSIPTNIEFRIFRPSNQDSSVYETVEKFSFFAIKGGLIEIPVYEKGFIVQAGDIAGFMYSSSTKPTIPVPYSEGATADTGYETFQQVDTVNTTQATVTRKTYSFQFCIDTNQAPTTSSTTSGTTSMTTSSTSTQQSSSSSTSTPVQPSGTPYVGQSSQTDSTKTYMYIGIAVGVYVLLVVVIVLAIFLRSKNSVTKSKSSKGKPKLFDTFDNGLVSSTGSSPRPTVDSILY